MTPSEEERMVAALDRVVAVEIAALRREIAITNGSAERALALAAQESHDRLEAHNNLIGQMKDQAAHFATREVVEINRESYIRRFDAIDRFQSRIVGALVLISVAMPVLTLVVENLIRG